MMPFYHPNSITVLWYRFSSATVCVIDTLLQCCPQCHTTNGFDSRDILLIQVIQIILRNFRKSTKNYARFARPVINPTAWSSTQRHRFPIFMYFAIKFINPNGRCQVKPAIGSSSKYCALWWNSSLKWLITWVILVIVFHLIDEQWVEYSRNWMRFSMV